MWEVLHVDGHVEKRKTKKADWTFEERGNTASDVIAKRCMEAAAADGISDAAALEEWNRQVEAKNWKRTVTGASRRCNSKYGWRKQPSFPRWCGGKCSGAHEDR
jgi:hypothetical protein